MAQIAAEDPCDSSHWLMTIHWAIR